MMMHSGTKLLCYVQLLDSALPIGGFSHSFGLEAYTHDGRIRTIAQLEQFIRGQLHSSLVRLDGLAIKGVYQAIEQQDAALLALYDKRVHAQRTPRELRESGHKMGKRLLKLARSLYPWMDFSLIDEAVQEHGAFCGITTIHGYINYQLEIGMEEAVTGHLYTSVNAYVNSALRLLPIGQTDAQMLIQKLLNDIDSEWSQIRDDDPEDMHSFGIAQEIYAMRHESLPARLFMS
ncbi:urease accessory UreF family protein [Paenibacillus taichungensis]|uniref:urease accessory protein UreF n=1 Tax=Paenibacillus taichungensis TaxID=484184 RepID=UPI002DBCE172|nr:urease accessory UreF family protein [Paenibacillus taichungensis]MEC0106743.1 urease accessory UreF family protein [Paenibacillus taichungensis]MEC0195327.1 urease accessory UreF family protein [Paenibacillus taichungensis]